MISCFFSDVCVGLFNFADLCCEDALLLVFSPRDLIFIFLNFDLLNAFVSRFAAEIWVFCILNLENCSFWVLSYLQGIFKILTV